MSAFINARAVNPACSLARPNVLKSIDAGTSTAGDSLAVAVSLIDGALDTLIRATVGSVVSARPTSRNPVLAVRAADTDAVVTSLMSRVVSTTFETTSVAVAVSETLGEAVAWAVPASDVPIPVSTVKFAEAVCDGLSTAVAFSLSVGIFVAGVTEADSLAVAVSVADGVALGVIESDSMAVVVLRTAPST
jgi:hypothetical protein